MFDNVVFVAMENQNYCNGVIVCGLSSTSFIPSLAAASSVDPNYQGYGVSGRSIDGCSAACYLALTSGSDQGKSDGYCPRASAPCLTVPNLISSLIAAGLTWQAYCAEGCPRGSDHFPFLAYSNTNPGDCAIANTCPNTFISRSVTTASFIAAANSANPPNFLWYTPTDSENMHDNSVSSGDTYIKNFLVGNGTVSSPVAGSLFASRLFQTCRVALVLWWDENSNPPEIFYGTNIEKGYLSSATYDHYSTLRMLEDNWNLPTLTSNDAAATGMLADFNRGPIPLSARFTYLPSTPLVNGTISFTGSVLGGTAPYTSSWNFGDGGTAKGLTATHSYTTTSNYTTTLTVTDSARATTKSSQTIEVANPGFAITSNARTVALMRSFSQNVTVILSSLSGFTGAVNLAVTITGTGVMVKLSDTNPSLYNGSVMNLTLTITTTYSATLGNYTITIRGTNGNLSRSLTIYLRVDPLGDFDADGIVGIADISVIFYHYGSTTTSPNWYPLADLNHDGVVNVVDFELAVANYS